MQRICAFLIDLLICIVIIALILAASLSDLRNLIFNDKTEFDYSIIWSLINFVRWLIVALIALFVYFCFLPVIVPGQTLGKKIVRIKVVKKNGGRVTFTTMFVREIIGRFLFDFTSFLVTMLLSVVLMFSPRHECLHDALAETEVIKK